MWTVLSVTAVCAQDFPLLHARRSQTTPFNNSCPLIDGKRAVVGCVATAVEHMINYWHFPEALTSEIAEYTTDKFSLPAVPEGTPIDWAHMQEDYLDSPYTDEAAKAVADLSLWVGQALKAKYGTSSTSASSERVVDVLQNQFGYKTVKICYRDSYTVPVWRQLVANELNNGRPIYYCGSYAGGAHAWVVDGVRDGMYHCNWGEDNFRDGWYEMDAFNEYQNPQDFSYPERFAGFASNQACIIAAPDEVETLAGDSIHTQDYVRVHDVTLLRQPSAEDLVLAEVTLENIHEDTLYYTLEGLTFTPSVWQEGDKDEFKEDGEFCGVCSFLLPPKQIVKHVGCFRFRKTGERVFCVTFDEQDFYCARTVNVMPAHKLDLVYSDLTVAFPKTGTAQILGKVTNNSATYTYGPMLHFELMKGEIKSYDDPEEAFSSRYLILNLPPGETMSYTEESWLHSPVRFKELEAGETYTLWLRQNWLPIVQSLIFTVPENPLSVPSWSVYEEDVVDSYENQTLYDLSGRKIHTPKGLYVKGNKVFWSPK